MARKRERIFAGFFAGLFIVTSSALTIGVIVQAVQNHKKPAADTAKLATPTPKSKEQTMNNSPKLQGTMLTNFTPVRQVNKVETTDTKVGTGDVVNPGATITFHYTGALAASGTIFQSSHDTGQPITYPLGQLIKGWQEGIPGMRVGGERRLLIPYAKGYGEAGQPAGGIPAKADLVFDIEVTAVKKQP